MVLRQQMMLESITRRWAPSSISETTLLDLPLEVLTCVCQHLDLRDLARVAATCKRLRHGDGGMETAELPTKSPMVTALREHAFPGGELIPSTRSIGCLESWVAYLARGVRPRRCRKAPPIAAGYDRTLIVDAARQLACGKHAAVGHGDAESSYIEPTPVAAMTGVRVRSISAGEDHSLALCWDGRVYSWGRNDYGQLGLGDELRRHAPVLLQGFEGVRGVASAYEHSLAVTQLGAVFSWGRDLLQFWRTELRPIIVKGFEGVNVRRVCAGRGTAFAIGEDGEVFRGGGDMTGFSAMAMRKTNPRPSALRRCGAFG
jgi:alpha-tubulin suppressor-like RCC1 family protein